MIGNDIQRVEELRYLISSSTYDILRRKRRGEAVSNAEAELNSMKDELTRLLSEVQDAGYVYMLMNKKRINELKSNFMALGMKERVMALEAQGEGGRMLSEMMNLLLLNKERKSDIATLILSLPAANDVVEGIRSVVEGYSDRATVRLENAPAAGRISLALKGVGLSAEEKGQVVDIGAPVPPASAEAVEELEDSEHEDLFGDVGNAPPHNPLATPVRPSVPQQQQIRAPQPPVAFIASPESDSPVAVIPPASVSKGAESVLSEQVASAASSIVENVMRSAPERHPHRVIAEAGISDVEHQPAKEQLRSEDLMPKLTYPEVCRKIDQIMGNHKMKRWVLGAFKDDAEREQYPKVQETLVKLLRLKSSMEAKGQTK
ncbi:Uncharacterised protein [uncultured archaeon]|nr:Uncharacterised protein [uncultured archaeon]